MNNLKNFFKVDISFKRFSAVLTKELIQLRRDPLILAMIICVPLIELVLFGYAINLNPKQMPTVVIANDYSEFTRAFINGLKHTDYFEVKDNVINEAESKKYLANDRAQFVITIPRDFTKRILRQNNPQILLEADATDPVATSSAINAAGLLAQSVFKPLYKGSLQYLQNRPKTQEMTIVSHARYNPEGITANNIVPGLIGVILSMTLISLTSLGLTKEREKGTMEHLLSTPVKPLEVMLGKLLSYGMLGYFQLFIILFLAKFLFNVPFNGNILLLILVTLPFITADLSAGLIFSSLAKTQIQASQMAMFYFLPSLLLSGFMFPFQGMPTWAEYIGSFLPLTYYLRIARGIILKGNDFFLIWQDFWPLIAFMVVAICIALKRYRKTLD